MPFPSTQTKDCREIDWLPGKVRHLKGPDKWAKIEKHILLFVTNLDYHTWIGVAVPWPVMADVLLASLVGSIRGMTESLFMLSVKCRCHRNLSPGSRNLLRAKRCVDDGCRIRTSSSSVGGERYRTAKCVCCIRRTRCLLDVELFRLASQHAGALL